MLAMIVRMGLELDWLKLEERGIGLVSPGLVGKPAKGYDTGPSFTHQSRRPCLGR